MGSVDNILFVQCARGQFSDSYFMSRYHNCLVSLFGFSKARSPSDKRGVCVTGISSQKYDKICIKLIKLFRGVNYK